MARVRSSTTQDVSPVSRSWIIGAVEFGHDGSLEMLQRRAAEAEAAGCDAIKIPHYRAQALFAESHVGGLLDSTASGRYTSELRRRLGEPKLQDLRRFASECVGRLGLVVAVFDPAALADIALLDSKIAMLSVEVPVATNLLLVEAVAETGRPALVEVNLLTPEQIKTMCRWFAPGKLTLVWRQSVRPSPTRTVENLFALVRLQQYSCPVGYAGSAGDSLAALVALGFGATVIEVGVSESGRAAHGGSPPDLGQLVSLVRRCQATPAGLPVETVETLSPSELDAMAELRPSLTAARPIDRGQTITAEMLTCKAPFRGLSPSLLPLVVGRQALYDIAQDEAITFGVIEF